MASIGVVGGGIVGLAVARELSVRRPGLRVEVLEKESSVGQHQTGHNSGVVHAGLYYRPGSLKAELCTRGRLLLREHCRDRGLPYDEVGKLVVAVDSSELGRFDALERTARENGVPGLRRLGPHELTEVEPHARGIAALHSPHTAITDFVAVAASYAEDVVAGGGVVRVDTEVVGIAREAGRVRLQTAGGGDHRFDQVVVCGGLQADRLGRLAGGDAAPRIVPFRGEYMTVSAAKQHVVRGMVYPVPDPAYPFLGVHFTRRVDGSLEVGPNAFLALSRDHYRRTAVEWRDAVDVLGQPAFWRFARRNWRAGLAELRGVASARAYMDLARRYVPDIGVADVTRARMGLRAQAMSSDGSLLDDFVIEQVDRVMIVRNAPSPAATSSLAIAEYVVDRVLG